MAPMRTRVVRKASLVSRIKGYLDPLDFLLWLSEELNSNELEDSLKHWATPIGVLFNLVFMVARASHGRSKSRGDNVFGDYEARRGSGWLSWFASFVVHFLVLVSVLNAVYTFNRTRHYRLFEASVDVQPNTSSARRVRVDSSPLSSSPLRYLSRVLAATTAASRAHPDATKDVWELAVWDPTPICLRLFTIFSPGHVLVYWLFLPLAPMDPRPSVTVVTIVLLTTLLSAQLSLLQHFFSQQSKDAALIHKEVQNEYDTKFVNPSLNRPVRDAGTQVLTDETPLNVAEVQTYTPTTYVNRGFRVNPNPNYSPQYDPDGVFATPTRTQQISRSMPTPQWRSPEASGTPLRGREGTVLRQAHLRNTPSAQPVGDGGSFGIYSQAHSPLRRPANPTPSMASIRHSNRDPIRERVSLLREGSPLKRHSIPEEEQQTTSSWNGGASFDRSERLSVLKGDGIARDRQWS